MAEGPPDQWCRMSTVHDPALQARLRAMAYRMLGSWHDAEDAVAEGHLRWQQLSDEERAAVREPAAWFTRVVSRVCLDQLRSARSRREEVRGVWLPEPQLGEGLWRHEHRDTADPADTVTLDDTVSYAFLVALERLTPAERISFVLHDVFGTPFPEVADIVGRSPDACRQLAVSARRNLKSEARERRVPEPARSATVSAFLDACRGGDIDALIALLDPDVTSVADGGRTVPVAIRPVVGATTVARYLVGVFAGLRRHFGDDVDFATEKVNGRAGVAIRHSGDLLAIVDLSIVDGAVTSLRIQADPGKLG